MFVDAIQQRCARPRRHGPEGDANRRPSRHANTPAQREDRIEHGSDRIGQRPSVHDRDRRANALSAAQEARPVGFELRPADRFSIGDAQMRRPKFGFRRSPLSPRRKDRAEVLEIFGLDEQLGEGRMGDIGALWPQSKFGVGCDLDVARPASRIGDGHAPNLGVVLSRNKHLKRCRQSPVASGDLDTILVEIDGIFVRLDARRLKACRPDGAAPRVPKKNIGAAIVSRGVFAPSRDSDIAPPAVSRAGRCHHHGIASVGKKLCRRRGLMNGNDPAPARGIRIAGARAGLDLRRPRPRRGDLARHPLLQQQFRRLNDRLGMEALSHRAVEDRVGDRDDRHALMMRHEGADESEALAFRNPGGGEIHRLIESIPAPGAQCRQSFEIRGRGRGIDHGRQAGRIRRDDAIFAQSAFQSEARHAKIGILIGQFQIAGIVGGFGNPPRQPEFFAIFDLTAHDEPIRLLEQTPRGRAHDERRHEILEH